MSHRGLRLFNDLLDEPPQEKLIKGRSKSLNERRNELLLDRLYHFKQIFGFDYEYVLEILSLEIFLVDGYIPQIIQRTHSQLYLRDLKLTKPSQKELEKKWPHMVWDKKELLDIYGTRKIA